MLKHLRATVVVLSLSVSAVRADSADDRLQKLHEIYQCPIFSYLATIHRVRFKSEQDRFLILEISNPADGRYYAQCAFFDRDRHIHCEAASPYYDDRLKEYFTSDRLKILSMLGYTTEISAKNYYIEAPVQDTKSLYDIAGLLVETVGRVFDMQLDERIIYHAPLVKRPPKQTSVGGFCAPMISSR